MSVTTLRRPSRIGIGARVRFFLPFVISGVLLLLLGASVRGQAGQLTAALGSAEWWLLAPAIVLYFIGASLRSLRWGQLLPEHHLHFSTLFRALIVGFTVNNLLPLRMGEVARAYLLARWGRVPYGATVASLVVERVLDGLSLAILLLVALWLVPAGPVYLFGFAVAVVVVGAVFLVLAAWHASSLHAIVEFFTRPLPRKVRAALLATTESVAGSLTVLHDPARLARLFALSLLAWCSELSVFFVAMFSVRIPGTYPQAILVGAAANFATLVPSAPGYAGTFDAMLTHVLQDAVSTTTDLAGAYDIIVHATLFLPVVIVGTLMLWRSHISFDQVTHTPAPAPGPETRYSSFPASGG